MSKFQMNGKVLKILGLALLLVVFVFAGSQILFAKSAGAQVMSGFYKMAASESQEGHMELWATTEEPSMAPIFDLFKLVMNYENTGMSGFSNVQIHLDDAVLLEGVMAVQEDVLYVDLLDLYGSYFYYDDGDFEAYMTQSYALREYMMGVSFKGIDFKAYVEAVEEALGDNLYKSDGRVYLELDEVAMLDLTEAVLQVVAADDAFVPVLHRELVGLLSLMIEDGFEFGGAGPEDWQELLSEIEDYETFEAEFNEGVSALLSDLERERDRAVEPGFNMVMVFDLDWLNTIEAMEMTFEVEGDLTLEMRYKNESAYDFNTYDKASGLDFEPFMSGESDLYEVAGEVLGNFSEKVQANDKLVEAIEGTEYYQEMAYWFGFEGIDEFFEMILSEFFYY
ncbi:hypothetical protein [Fusibacter tunisiensis]|uniref:Uncharacterized protein n=1 Tax=Fusibacter tunisiensis TaxID=1008308 RepID=A0ABS2MNA0_9FIRM|nr:hypothetical protein [Fusibacter tunisiensis]MBM7560869.1 hypothetical protein [Fusibacter tunisiensis]